MSLVDGEGKGITERGGEGVWREGGVNKRLGGGGGGGGGEREMREREIHVYVTFLSISLSPSFLPPLK